MAGKIVGITIDIAGKTSNLVSGLKSADAALTTTNNALKSVNQALKFDGNNVDLLTSKSKLLADAIDQNSERLDILKATAEEAMKTLGEEGGVSQAQMAELQAEMERLRTRPEPSPKFRNGAVRALPYELTPEATGLPSIHST